MNFFMIAERKFLKIYSDTLRKFVCSASKDEIKQLYYSEIQDDGYSTIDVDDALDSIVDKIKNIKEKRTRIKKKKITLNI